MGATKKAVGRCVHPERGEPTVQIMAMPSDTNWLGDIFGGWLMSHADMAGAILAYRRAGGKVVTVAIDDFLFLQPVYTGDVVSFFCRLIRAGTTSMKVAVEMFAERPGTGPDEEIKVSQATITYVHIGDDRKSQPIPAEHPR